MERNGLVKHESKEGKGGKAKGGPENGTDGKRGFSAGLPGTSHNASPSGTLSLAYFGLFADCAACSQLHIGWADVTLAPARNAPRKSTQSGKRWRILFIAA
jgi:hypothetical protein